MEAEICDLDELTGSALARPASDSLASLSLLPEASRISRAASRSRGFVLTVPSFRSALN